MAGEAERLVERWFSLEDPTRLEPAEREMFIEAELDSGLKLRGIIDRVDVAPTGDVRIVDYKTGKAPRPEYAEGALFQMKFYALVVWRLKQVVPRRLQLVYLGSGDVVTYDPVVADLERVERKLLALWEAIRLATETGDWRPRPTKLCGWCDHQAVCPEFGGLHRLIRCRCGGLMRGGGDGGGSRRGAVAGAASGDEAGGGSGEGVEVPGAGSGEGAVAGASSGAGVEVAGAASGEVTRAASGEGAVAGASSGAGVEVAGAASGEVTRAASGEGAETAEAGSGERAEVAGAGSGQGAGAA